MGLLPSENQQSHMCGRESLAPVLLNFGAMSFSARLFSDLISVESGATAPLSVEIANKGQEEDRYELQLEGLDPEWTALPVPEFAVGAGESAEQKIFFKPPRVSESTAGNYPFVLKVRSLSTGDSKSLQGVLQIKPFHHLSMEVSPKKGHVSPLHRRETFDLTVINLGNAEHTLQLFGFDPEEACAFSFEHEQVVLSPGQQKTVEVDVSASSSMLFSSSRLFGFSISGRSIENPSVVASAQAQLEQRPLVTPGSLLFLVLVAIVVGLWFYLIPKPPTIALAVDRHNAQVGEIVTLTWRANNANDVWVLAGNEMLVDAGPTEGGYKYTTTEPGTIEFEAYSQRDNKKSEVQHVQLFVSKPPPVPDPKIDLFKGPATASSGVPFRVSYKVNDSVKEAYIAETGQPVDLNVEEIAVTAPQAGTYTYTLVAKNAAAVVAKKSIKVVVEDASKAVIVSFTASSTRVDPTVGRVTLNWQITDAKTADLSDGVRDFVVDPTSTNMDVSIAKDSTFTLTAYDDKGRPVKKSLKVQIEAQPPQTPTDQAGGAIDGGGRR